MEATTGDPHLRAALPDLQDVSGTHAGQRVQFHAVVIVRLESGRIVDTWSMNDAPASLNA
jgi:predicted ester cyclase